MEILTNLRRAEAKLLKPWLSRDEKESRLDLE